MNDTSSIPTQKMFLQNLELKMSDDEFIGDIMALIRPTEKYNHDEAFELVKTSLVGRIDENRKIFLNQKTSKN